MASEHMTLEECTTVEEVESFHCKECSTRTGHWGWCDAPWIHCKFKDKIKKILGETESSITDPEQHINDILERKTE